MQLFYLTIARDPVRFRPLMPLARSPSFPSSCRWLILWLQGRTCRRRRWRSRRSTCLIAAAFLHAWRITLPG